MTNDQLSFMVNIVKVRLRLKSTIACLTTVSLAGCNAIDRFFAPTEPWLTPDELVVVVNQADPLSVEIGNYYQQQRKIPQRNVISVNFAPNRVELSPEEFNQIKAAIEVQIPSYIQAYALTWAAPYRVGCMSITSAFALGFDPAYCAKGCQLTKANPYFNHQTTQPFQDLQIRPTIAIAATHFEQAKALIDRGIAADGTYPSGTAYLLSTSDNTRNVRAGLYPQVTQHLASRFKTEVIQADTLEHKTDVMFYFTGLAQVERIERNQFLPGAIADHLTSFGGMLTDSPQMSSLRWLEAGATGSYGNVVEPCNFPQKFPHPAVAMAAYLNGDTLLEAYWKSIAMPGQGIFIGEPLARPFSKF
ncbi:MAG: TIGR03790 family protein [Leptolyngbyaceae cyanobacterium bins.302]|nr:TIGR03790 family protein [Leptolyngbyaceae cyanobacterium bins.302]